MPVLDVLRKVSEKLLEAQNIVVDGLCELCQSELDFSTDDPEPPPTIIIINLNSDSTDDPEPPPSVSFSTDDPEPPPGESTDDPEPPPGSDKPKPDKPKPDKPDDPSNT